MEHFLVVEPIGLELPGPDDLDDRLIGPVLETLGPEHAITSPAGSGLQAVLGNWEWLGQELSVRVAEIHAIPAVVPNEGVAVPKELELGFAPIARASDVLVGPVAGYEVQGLSRIQRPGPASHGAGEGVDVRYSLPIGLVGDQTVGQVP